MAGTYRSNHRRAHATCDGRGSAKYPYRTLITFDAEGGGGGCCRCCCLPAITASCCDDTISIGTASTPVKQPSPPLPVLPSNTTTVSSTKSTNSSSRGNVSIGEYSCRYPPCDEHAVRVLLRPDVRGTSFRRRRPSVLVDDDVIIDEDAVVAMVVFCLFFVFCVGNVCVCSSVFVRLCVCVGVCVCLMERICVSIIRAEQQW